MTKRTIENKARELNLTSIIVRAKEIEGIPEEVEKLLEALNLNWGGFMTGYDYLIVRADYISDEHDFNSVYSKHHY